MACDATDIRDALWAIACEGKEEMKIIIQDLGNGKEWELYWKKDKEVIEGTKKLLAMLAYLAYPIELDHEKGYIRWRDFE